MLTGIPPGGGRLSAERRRHSHPAQSRFPVHRMQRSRIEFTGQVVVAGEAGCEAGLVRRRGDNCARGQVAGTQPLCPGHPRWRQHRIRPRRQCDLVDGRGPRALGPGDADMPLPAGVPRQGAGEVVHDDAVLGGTHPYVGPTDSGPASTSTDCQASSTAAAQMGSGSPVRQRERSRSCGHCRSCRRRRHDKLKNSFSSVSGSIGGSSPAALAVAHCCRPSLITFSPARSGRGWPPPSA